MESAGKQASSETSSEETHRSEQVKDESTGTKRCYECTFCRRGFTNAQALGGHMNIHRKDRAKAKQHTGSSSTSPFSSTMTHQLNDETCAPISSQPGRHYQHDVEAQRNYSSHMYLQPSHGSGGAYRQLPYSYSIEDHSFGSRSQLALTMNNQQLLGANLSLRINSSRLEDGGVVRNSEEIDLELRLGHG
ncbi:hypothetical protein FNV43_RR01499 [Rhamnella rubrinervis]|uniref:C2H2-type domain-containing protein n=1 Tax=Rhamnella rubrinervis TaxID=2594499 RepID=A0A8K0MTD4_9ROSA|nr:hypothetical protein FNV43_RR01499 [Rhamnella rubrinervis]